MRILLRLVVFGLGAYGAKILYDKYSGSMDRATRAGRAAVERVGRVRQSAKGSSTRRGRRPAVRGGAAI